MEGFLEGLTLITATMLKQMIGKATAPVKYEIEKGQIRRFAAAIGETNAIHFDEEAAKEAGYRGVVATPTFAAALHHFDEFYEMLSINPLAMMHAEEEYEYFQPICQGDVITVTHRVSDAYEKDAAKGKLLFVVIETRGEDTKEKLVFKGRRVLVELKV